MDIAAQKKQTIWTYNFVALMVTNMVLFFGTNMMSTLLPKYLSAMGNSTTVIGFVVGMFSVTALGTRPITGPMIDCMNKKKLYMSMLCFVAVTCFGYSFVESVPAIIFFRLMHGIGNGCSSALALTLATESLPAEKLSSGIGIFGLGNVLPQAVAPGLGLAISERWGYQTTFFICGLLVVTAIILSSRMRIADPPKKKLSYRFDNMIAKEAIVPALFLFFLSLARASFGSYLVIYITEYRIIEGISLYYTIYAVALVVSRTFAGKVADRFGMQFAIYPSYICFAITLIMLAFCTQTWQLWTLAVFNALGSGTSQNQHQALVMKIANPEHRGAASTTMFFGIDAGDLLGPIINGMLIQYLSYTKMFLCSLIPLAACTVLFFFYFRRHRAQLSSAKA